MSSTRSIVETNYEKKKITGIKSIMLQTRKWWVSGKEQQEPISLNWHENKTTWK